MSKDKLIVGIDVGTTKITTVIATKGDGLPNVIGVSTVYSKGLRKGQVVNIEEAVSTVSTSVEAAERMAGTNIGSARISLGGVHIACQNSKGVVAVSEPDKEITEEDMQRVIDAAQAVSLASTREVLHVLPRHFTVDSQEGIVDPIGMSGVRLEVDTHIITCSTTAARNLAKCVEELGVSVSGLVFSGLASSYSVLSDTEKELGVILVDIGGGTSDVCIFVDGALAYSGVIPVGAKNITNDLAIGLRVSLESAEKIKLALSQKKLTPSVLAEEKKKEENKQVSSLQNKDDVDLTELGLPEELKKASRRTLIDGIIKPRLAEIFTLVGLELQKSGLVGQTPAGIVVTGAGAETIGITETAKQRLSLPVRIGMPTGLSGLVDELQGPASACAVGLILYGAKKEVSETTGLPFVSNISGTLGKIPLKGIAKKLTDLLKSFLP